MGRIPKSADVVQQQRSISIKNAIEKYRLEMWSDDPVGIPTPTKITTDDYDKMKEHYLNDLIVRRNQRVHQEDENKDAIDLFASSLTSLRDKLKRGTTHIHLHIVDLFGHILTPH